MSSNDKNQTYFDIFFSSYRQDFYDTLKDRRFVYYTNAETAKKIIENNEIWLRNSLLMNDYSEISYGLSVGEKVMEGPIGKKIYSLAEGIYPGVKSEVESLLIQNKHFWKKETYLTCLSLHNLDEDRIGRLSMWRAYGDVALVMNNKPFLNENDQLGVSSTPVYYGENDYIRHLNYLTEQIKTRAAGLKSRNEVDQKTILVYAILMSYFFAAIGIKHSGFSEEKEWRLFFHPQENTNPLLEKRIENIGGIVQPIYALKLKDDPDNGMHKADIPNLLDRIIIGPTSQPHVIKSAFVELLAGAGVDNAAEKVYVSDIPLRSSSR